LIYLDLGSTNGSKVNGEPVSEVVLGVGDRLEVGETTLVLEVEEASG
jgi:pSer/pThr/pTyr-binding forkhead associated (FHA) protein